jgi:hypothetical protein
MRRLARAYCLVAGGCDVITGLLLVFAPRFALDLMRVGDPLTEMVWMRFIGAFVLGVGSLYLYALMREPRGGARLAHVMEATAIVRCCVGAFTGASIAVGVLSPAWLSVTLSDLGFAAAQIILLRLRAFDHDG